MHKSRKNGYCQCGRLSSLQCLCGAWVCMSHRFIADGSSVFCGPCYRRWQRVERQQESEVSHGTL